MSTCKECKHYSREVSKESGEHYLCKCPKLLEKYDVVLIRPNTKSCEEFKNEKTKRVSNSK